MRLIFVLVLSLSIAACSSEKKTHLDANKKLAAKLQERKDFKEIADVADETPGTSNRITLNEQSPVLLWKAKKAPYQVVELKVKPKSRALIIHSSYDKQWTKRRAVVPDIILLQKDSYLDLPRTKVGHNPYCGDYACLEAFYTLRKVPAGTYKMVVIAPVTEGKEAKKDVEEESDETAQHTYFGELSFKTSEHDNHQ